MKSPDEPNVSMLRAETGKSRFQENREDSNTVLPRRREEREEFQINSHSLDFFASFAPSR
jgi:hypothetical protein